ncbi:hypothetical protein K504DRAFT_268928 [Pleomassaria siparia CBS 279.74]|uniref:Uncharacterized protein n=1 Tax=Pleomassaria siparia CBS 279.74 TaxID=1314801 RepID=A0A6G1K8U7_9PLEO|nr:hypothetical protein K504DRAFT_268928 [Pleomassaria siparia CBS 279.74]
MYVRSILCMYSVYIVLYFVGLNPSIKLAHCTPLCWIRGTGNFFSAGCLPTCLSSLCTMYVCTVLYYICIPKDAMNAALGFPLAASMEVPVVPFQSRTRPHLWACIPWGKKQLHTYCTVHTIRPAEGYPRAESLRHERVVRGVGVGVGVGGWGWLRGGEK